MRRRVVARVQHGRFTHQHDGAVVVFLLGMRVNRWRRVRSWFPVLASMPRMQAELRREEGRGLLGVANLLGAQGPVVVSYWSSLDALVAYAHDADGEHRPAWKAFNAALRRRPGDVGIWHETYVAQPGGHESVYSDMPLLGLAAATSSVPVGTRTETARERITRSGAAPR
jgi:hypothetical protein